MSLGSAMCSRAASAGTTTRVRITGQLIDTATGRHLWADRFDGELKDIFGVQDQVTSSVVGAIVPKLERVEIERAKRKPTENLDAYDYYLRGRASFHEWTQERNNDALRCFIRAIEIDLGFATAYGMAALCYEQRMMNGWMIHRQLEVREAARLAERAVELGRDDAIALSSAGIVRLRVIGDIDAAAVFIDQALALNPNLVQAWYGGSFVKNCNGEPEAALEYLKHVMRLSPIDPLLYRVHTGTALAHLLAGRYDEASLWAGTGIAGQSKFSSGVANGGGEQRPRRVGSSRRGRQWRACANSIPLCGYRTSRICCRCAGAGDFSRYAEGLRVAGLPE